MQKSALLRALQEEIRRHDFDHFIGEPPAIAQGGNGVILPGCLRCRKRLNTIIRNGERFSPQEMPVGFAVSVRKNPVVVKRVGSYSTASDVLPALTGARCNFKISFGFVVRKVLVRKGFARRESDEIDPF